MDPCPRDPGATIEEIAGPPTIVDARAWAAGGAGRIWVTVRGPDTLVTIDPVAPDPGSAIAVIDAPLVKAPDGVWLGEDGAIWFANTGASSIGRLDPAVADPAHTVQTFGTPPELQEPFDSKDGPDGWLWFTDKAANALGRIYGSPRPRGLTNTHPASRPSQPPTLARRGSRAPRNQAVAHAAWLS